MRSFVFAVSLASSCALAQNAGAQAVRACPAGQAIQSFDASGRDVQCVAVPAPVDLGAVNARIDAEAVARMAADQQVRDGTTEAGLSGRYAVVGTALCTRASGNFSSTFAPAGTVQPQSFTYRGTRTFDAAGMHGDSLVYSITYPAFAGGTFVNAGGASVVHAAQDWTYEIGPDRTLTIAGSGSQGEVVQGNGAGVAQIRTAGAPPLMGAISKDWRTIVLTNAAMAVEDSIAITPAGEFHTPRICTRSETLTKLAD